MIFKIGFDADSINMKKLNIPIFSFFLVSISCNAQSTDINTFSGEVKINNQITFGDTEQVAINVFGQPNNITTDFWEISQKDIEIYHYDNGLTLFLTDEGLQSFKLISSNYYLEMGNFHLQVGNNINSIQNKFPKSYSYRNSGGTSIALGTGDYRFLLILFDSNNKITERTF